MIYFKGHNILVVDNMLTLESLTHVLNILSVRACIGMICWPYLQMVRIPSVDYNRFYSSIVISVIANIYILCRNLTKCITPFQLTKRVPCCRLRLTWQINIHWRLHSLNHCDCGKSSLISTMFCLKVQIFNGVLVPNIYKLQAFLRAFCLYVSPCNYKHFVSYAHSLLFTNW